MYRLQVLEADLQTDRWKSYPQKHAKWN